MSTSIQVLRGLLSDTTLGIDGADGANGLPGAPAATIAMGVAGGFVGWWYESAPEVFYPLYQVPSGETGEDMQTETVTIFVPQTIYHETAAVAKLFGADVGSLGYAALTILLKGRGVNAAVSAFLNMKINNDAVITGNNYRSQRVTAESGGTTAGQIADMVMGYLTGGTAPAGEFETMRIDIYFAASASKKVAVSLGGMRYSATQAAVAATTLHWSGTAGITRLDFNASGGNFAVDSEIHIIGWKEVEVVTGVTGTGVQGAAGAVGADGLTVQMQSVPTEDGECVDLQWKYTTAEEWTTLATVPICADGGDELPDSPQNRCGVAHAITQELGRIYRIAKLEPDVWDELQAAALEVATAESAVAAIGTVGLSLFGGAIFAGLALYGVPAAAVGVFLHGILDLTVDNADEFTSPRAAFLTAGLYCILQRRETTQIDIGALREWVSFIADAGFPETDKKIILGILGMTAVQYWRNEAAIAAPKINPCVDELCLDRGIDFTYEFVDYIAPLPLLQFDDPLGAALLVVNIGRRQGSISAVPGFSNIFTYNFTLYFGRNVLLTGVEIDAAYYQTVANISPIISLAGEGMSAVEYVTDVDADTVTLHWQGEATVDRVHVSGQVAGLSAFDDLVSLFITRAKFCGHGWPALGTANVSPNACAPAPDVCEGFASFGTLKTWNFRTGQHGWGGGNFIALRGFKTVYGQNTVVGTVTQRFYSMNVTIGIPGGGQMRHRRSAITYTYVPRTAAGNNESPAPMIRIVAADAAQTYEYTITPTAGTHTHVWEGNVIGPNLRIEAWASREDVSYPATATDPGGSLTVHSLCIWHEGGAKAWPA